MNDVQRKLKNYSVRLIQLLSEEHTPCDKNDTLLNTLLIPIRDYIESKTVRLLDTTILKRYEFRWLP